MLKIKLSLSILVLSIVITTVECGGDSDPIDGQLIPTTEEILDAPTILTVDDKDYILDSYLWRDFMPPRHEEGGSNLIASISIIDQDSITISQDISLDYLWVVNEEITWATPFSNEGRSDPAFKMNEIARNGPKWEIGISVDVVARVIVDGKEFKILAKDQYIGRSD